MAKNPHKYLRSKQPYFEDYLRAMCLPGTWAGDIELAAVADALQVCIVVFQQ